jgi:hypothetical protein
MTLMNRIRKSVFYSIYDDLKKARLQYNRQKLKSDGIKYMERLVKHSKNYTYQNNWFSMYFGIFTI